MEGKSTRNVWPYAILGIVAVSAIGLTGWCSFQALSSDDNNLPAESDELSKTRTALLQAEQRNSDLEATLQRARANHQAQLQRKNAEILKQKTAIERISERARGPDAEEERRRQLERLDLAIRLLTVDRRVAHLTVRETWTHQRTGEQYMQVEFVEVDDDRQPLDKPTIFQLKGDRVHIDSWVVHFRHSFTEPTDSYPGASLCLFKSIYGNSNGPLGSYPLTVGDRAPLFGRQGEPSESQHEMWRVFWEISSDSSRAESFGIWLSPGSEDSVQVEAGKTYPVLLQSTGEISIGIPIDVSPVDPEPAAAGSVS